jgi:hypothetical protein
MRRGDDLKPRQRDGLAAGGASSLCELCAVRAAPPHLTDGATTLVGGGWWVADRDFGPKSLSAADLVLPRATGTARVAGLLPQLGRGAGRMQPMVAPLATRWLLRRRCTVMGQAWRCLSSSGYRGRGGQQGSTPPPPVSPLAVPFAVHDSSEAADRFINWTQNQADSLLFNAQNAVTLKGVRPVYLPFFSISGQLQVRYRGELGYTSYGRHHKTLEETRKTTWYTKGGLRPPVVTISSSLQYAGFEFRRKYIETAVEDQGLTKAMPLTPGMLPEGCGVHAFELKPSLAAARTIATLPVRAGRT